MSVFFKAFYYAWSGIVHGFSKERNLKFHFVAMIGVLIVSTLTGLTMIEWSIILLLIAGVVALEMMNSAIERTVDLVTKEYHPLAKQAKDLAAGAVLIFSIASAVIGLMIFLPKWIFLLQSIN